MYHFSLWHHYQKKVIIRYVVIVFCLLLLGPVSSAYTTTKVLNPAQISGIVRYTGPTIRPKRLPLSGDIAYCRKFSPISEDLLVSSDGGLSNVVVSLENITTGKEIPTKVPVMAEIKCTFTPHVLSMTAGSKLVLHNEDPVLNTFHAIDVASGRTLFNIGMPNKNQKVYRKIRQAGVIKIVCDVHPWEVAYVVAFPHPYHTVTDKQGRFTLAEVPPGRYVLSLWHERLGKLRQPLVIKAGSHPSISLTYK